MVGVDQALDELGKSEAEVSEVRDRHRGDGSSNLGDVDAALSALSEGVSIDRTRASVARQAASEVPSADWEQEDTEIEIMDESDFVLLVDENDLEELEKVGEDDARVASPMPETAENAQDDGFFKKLFGNRGSRPPQAS